MLWSQSLSPSLNPRPQKRTKIAKRGRNKFTKAKTLLTVWGGSCCAPRTTGCATNVGEADNILLHPCSEDGGNNENSQSYVSLLLWTRSLGNKKHTYGCVSKSGAPPPPQPPKTQKNLVFPLVPFYQKGEPKEHISAPRAVALQHHTATPDVHLVVSTP